MRQYLDNRIIYWVVYWHVPIMTRCAIVTTYLRSCWLFIWFARLCVHLKWKRSDSPKGGLGVPSPLYPTHSSLMWLLECIRPFDVVVFSILPPSLPWALGNVCKNVRVCYSLCVSLPHLSMMYSLLAGSVTLTTICTSTKNFWSSIYPSLTHGGNPSTLEDLEPSWRSNQVLAWERLTESISGGVARSTALADQCWRQSGRTWCKLNRILVYTI